MAQNNTSRPESEKQTGYEYATFVVDHETEDYDVKANQSALFGGSTSRVRSNTNSTRRVARITTTQTIGLKFNDVEMPAIDMTSSENPWVEVNLNLNNIYISNNSGTGTSIGITLYQ